MVKIIQTNSVLSEVNTDIDGVTKVIYTASILGKQNKGVNVAKFSLSPSLPGLSKLY